MAKSYSIAMEGIFDPEATVDTLLATVKENITSKVTTVDQAASLENRLSEEAAEFNSMLATISNAMRQCEAGEITKEEALAAAKPCVDALKERCEALKLGGVDVKDDDITENEIAMLREYIVGCKDIVASHKEALQDCPIAQNEEKSKEASEGVLSYLGNMDVANEASLMMQVRNSNNAKTATALYKNAKKLYAMGSKDKAKTYMQQAKAKYEKCLEEAKKVGKERKIERTVGTKANKVTFKDKDPNYSVYKNEAASYVVRYFEDRVDTCEAYLRQWANKAGNKDLQETKEMLKKERQEEKARIRAERKAAKEKAASEAALLDEQISALESLMDGYELDLTLDAAMEAEGSDAPASKASGIGSKLRAAFGKLKNAIKKGDKKTADEANAEVKAAAKELGDAANGADEEGKKKLSTAAKIGIAAAAAAALVVGEVALGQVLGKKAEKAGKSGDDLNTLTRLIVQSSDAMMKGLNKTAKLAGKGIDKLTDKANKANLDRFAKKTEANNKMTDTDASNKAQDKNISKYQNTEDRIARTGYAAKTAADKMAYKTRGTGLTFTKKEKATEESFTDLDGAGFLATLAMEEANFSDDVPLTEIENEEGRGFDDDAQGEDMTDEAIVGADDLDDVDEVEESVMESTLSIMMLEDGLDPDED